MSEQSIEIQNANQTIQLLKDYAGAKTQQKKDVLLNQIRSINLWVYFALIKNYKPLDLVARLEKAMLLDKYRPKNMPVAQLAINKDLDNINGEFDTFDSKLAQMVKNKANPKTIRERFKRGITNISMLAKQFSMDWICRLNNHKDLVNSVRNATSDNMVTAYNDLFEVLNKDFCDEYKCRIKQMVITDWATSDIKPDYWSDDTLGFHHATGELVLTKKEKKEFDKFINNGKKIEEYPGFIRYSHVLVNIANVRKLHSNPTYFFYSMISVFAHEMHHALDYQNSHVSAIGAQIYKVDNEFYTIPSKEDENAYINSATEQSSHEIQNELFNQLQHIRF